MENENPNESNLLDTPYFKLSFPNQNYKKLNNFQLWRKQLFEKFGQNYYEILCQKDNIIFYKREENAKCPICNNHYYICKFCYKAELKGKFKNCCIKASIKDLNDKKTKFDLKDNDKRKEFIQYFFGGFIPYLYYFLLGGHLFFIFIRYKIVQLNSYLKIIALFCSLSTLFISPIVFTFFYYEFYLSIIIVSLPLCLKPLKIYLGLIDAILSQ